MWYHHGREAPNVILVQAMWLHHDFLFTIVTCALLLAHRSSRHRRPHVGASTIPPQRLLFFVSTVAFPALPPPYHRVYKCISSSPLLRFCHHLNPVTNSASSHRRWIYAVESRRQCHVKHHPLLPAISESILCTTDRSPSTNRLSYLFLPPASRRDVLRKLVDVLHHCCTWMLVTDDKHNDRGSMVTYCYKTNAAYCYHLCELYHDWTFHMHQRLFVCHRGEKRSCFFGCRRSIGRESRLDIIWFHS